MSQQPSSPKYELKDIPTDVFANILSVLPAQSAMQLGIAHPEVYRHFRQQFVKLKDFYENVPTPTEVNQIVNDFVENAKIELSYSMTANDDFMEDDFLTPALHLTRGQYAASLRFFDLGKDDNRSVEMKMVRVGTVPPLVSHIVIHKQGAVAPYVAHIVGGMETRYDKELLTIATMLPHYLGKMIERVTIPAKRREITESVMRNSIARIDAVYPKSVRSLQVYPAAYTQGVPYSASKNIVPRTSPKKDWFDGGKKK